MKKAYSIVALLLALVMALSGMGVACAEEGASNALKVYAVGDTMDDFTITLTDGTDVTLSELLKTHKAVLLNIWATWCGPCRMAMKTIQPLKDELWGKCAFVYVTSPTSPQATWSKMVPDIHGDHFYVSEKQWTTLMKQFQVQGIPAYIVVDSKGKVQQKHIGFPGEDVLREELNKAKGK